MDRRRLIAGLSVLSIPAHIAAFMLAPGSAGAITAAAGAGLVNMALLPPVVIVAQEVLPGGAALASGIVMGLAWATGSVGVLGTGLLGDVIGARGAALFSIPVMFVAALLAAHPALRSHRRPLATGLA